MTEAVKEAKDAKKEAVVELEKGADTVVSLLALSAALLCTEVLGRADLLHCWLSPALLCSSSLSWPTLLESG